MVTCMSTLHTQTEQRSVVAAARVRRMLGCSPSKNAHGCLYAGSGNRLTLCVASTRQPRFRFRPWLWRGTSVCHESTRGLFKSYMRTADDQVLSYPYLSVNNAMSLCYAKKIARSISLTRLRSTLLRSLQHHASQRQRTTPSPRSILANTHKRLLCLQRIRRVIELLSLFYQRPILLEVVCLVAVLLGVLLDQRARAV